MALHHESFDSHPERILNLRGFEGSYDWGGLTFPVALNEIGIFKQKKDMSVNMLGLSGEKIYILKNPSLIVGQEWPISSS